MSDPEAHLKSCESYDTFRNNPKILQQENQETTESQQLFAKTSSQRASKNNSMDIGVALRTGPQFSRGPTSEPQAVSCLLQDSVQISGPDLVFFFLVSHSNKGISSLKYLCHFHSTPVVGQMKAKT